MELSAQSIPEAGNLAISVVSTLYIDPPAIAFKQKNLARVILEVAEDAASEGVIWLEPAFDADRYSIMRDAPSHKLFNSAEEGWQFALSQAEYVSQKTGVGIGFISAIDRTQPVERGIKRAKLTAKIVKSRQHLIRLSTDYFDDIYPGIIGLGLHGNEEGFPPELFKDAFRIGLDGTDLLSLPHAGEIAPSPGKGSASVATALDLLKADRIQHGVLAIEDPNLILKLAQTKICLDVCPSSNIQLSVFSKIGDHPLPELIKAGVICTIGSDDPLLFGPSLVDEYQICRKELKLDDSNLACLARNSFIYSGAPREVKQFGLSQIEKWLKV
ncbi:adenosine deaminase [Alphaproteobacteria bacterium]|nr:adenosine deaminase [Alphaproteobacteria bacterium]